MGQQEKVKDGCCVGWTGTVAFDMSEDKLEVEHYILRSKEKTNEAGRSNKFM